MPTEPGAEDLLDRLASPNSRLEFEKDYDPFAGVEEPIPGPAPIRDGFPGALGKAGHLYAIALEMDMEALRGNYGDPYNNAYVEIHSVLQRHGFHCHQDSIYFGGDTVTSVACVLAAMDLARTLPWFAASVREIRLLRIEEINDLIPAVQQACREA
jgi:virulence-associated protein VapD